MKTNKCLLFVCMILHHQSVFPAPADSEMVWLKDVTTSYETDKRTSTDLDLPDELTFQLSRGSTDLTLPLKRNHLIDPNADVYFVRNLHNGQPHLEKAENLGKEDLAYYLDKENWAFKTVRCVRRSNGQCHRIINGNIRIGERNYDLRKAESDITSRNVFDVPDLLGTLYILRDQANNPRISIERNTVNIDVEKVEKELTDHLGLPQQEHDKNDNFLLRNSELSTRNVERFHNIGSTDKRKKDSYWIEITVLLDSTIWDLFLSLAPAYEDKVVHATRRKREYYSHIINGVHLPYNEISDHNLDISVTLRDFHILQDVLMNAQYTFEVGTLTWKSYIDAEKYLDFISKWDEQLGNGPHYDHTMLFTRHDLYNGSIEENDLNGLAKDFGICVPGERVSLVQEGDYFETVRTAAHELGHNIGADHDGEHSAVSCPAADSFIMAADVPKFDPEEQYSQKPWRFSRCSILTFKRAMKARDCTMNPGIYFHKEEWEKYTNKLPGEAYSKDEQCRFINGPKSKHCGRDDASICLYMQCIDPRTQKCSRIPVTAAPGTSCGTNKWCLKGNCEPKHSK